MRVYNVYTRVHVIHTRMRTFVTLACVMKPCRGFSTLVLFIVHVGSGNIFGISRCVWSPYKFITKALKCKPSALEKHGHRDMYIQCIVASVQGFEKMATHTLMNA